MTITRSHLVAPPASLAACAGARGAVARRGLRAATGWPS